MTTEADKLAEALHRRIHECDCSDDRSRCGSCLNDLGLLVAYDIHRAQGEGKMDELEREYWNGYNRCLIEMVNRGGHSERMEFSALLSMSRIVPPKQRPAEQQAGNQCEARNASGVERGVALNVLRYQLWKKAFMKGFDGYQLLADAICSAASERDIDAAIDAAIEQQKALGENGKAQKSRDGA